MLYAPSIQLIATTFTSSTVNNDLLANERIYYRDLLRSARYAALRDAEGFREICFALEALGVRLCGERKALGGYEVRLKELASKSPLLTELPEAAPSLFGSFSALFELVRSARNDAMHTGAYARHATQAAIELSIGFEDAMSNITNTSKVHDVMVRAIFSANDFDLLGGVRQKMLAESFSFVPVRIDGEWKLIEDIEVAKYLRQKGKSEVGVALAKSITDADHDGLKLNRAIMIEHDESVTEALAKLGGTSRLLLVVDPRSQNRLCGIVSPFELI
jgi:hypothetical protein